MKSNEVGPIAPLTVLIDGGFQDHGNQRCHPLWVFDGTQFGHAVLVAHYPYSLHLPTDVEEIGPFPGVKTGVGLVEGERVVLPGSESKGRAVAFHAIYLSGGTTLTVRMNEKKNST